MWENVFVEKKNPFLFQIYIYTEVVVYNYIVVLYTNM